jgi:hypothetical protein
MGGHRKGSPMRHLIGLIALAGVAGFVPVVAGTTSAGASTAVAAPSCLADGGSKVSCDESSSPISATVTWYIYDAASTPQNYTTTGGRGLTWGCAGSLSVYFSYVYSGVTYVSGTGRSVCVKGYP